MNVAEIRYKYSKFFQKELLDPFLFGTELWYFIIVRTLQFYYSKLVILMYLGVLGQSIFCVFPS
jgi:hypothetical protein